MITKRDLQIYQGSNKSYRATVTVKNTGEAWTGLVGATAITLTIKRSLNEATALVVIPYTAAASDLASGIVVFRLTSTNAAKIEHQAVYDICVTKSDGEKVFVVYGNVYVQRKVG